MLELSRREFLRDATVSATATILSGCTTLPKTQLTLRSKREALISYRMRSFLSGRRTPNSQLEDILNTNLADSTQIGLVNSHLQEEYEDVDLGNISLAIKSWDPIVRTGKQNILLMANTPKFTAFRGDDESIIRVFDRTVWAANNGQEVTAIIETDKATPENLTETVNMLLDLGIKSFRIGNETNNPITYWLADPRQIYEFAVLVRSITKARGINANISLPALAYYGNGEHLRELAKYCHRVSNGVGLPFNRYSFNFYGPIYDLIPRIELMRNVGRQEGIDNLKLDISENGNPGPEIAIEKIPDAELAQQYIPQSLALIIGSKLVDQVNYYSLYNGENPSHSLMRLQGNRLIPKTSFQAYKVMTKLLAKLQTIELDDSSNYAKVEGLRTDGIHFSVIWAKDHDQPFKLAPQDQVFDSLGRSVKETYFMVLKKQTRSYMAGPARIIIHNN